MDFNDFSKGLNAKNLQQENRVKDVINRGN